MRLVFWGVRGSIPCCSRGIMKMGGNTACLEIRTRNNDLIILDAGSGIRSLGVEMLRTRKVEKSQLEEKVDFMVEKHIEYLSDSKSESLRALDGSQPFSGKAHIFLSHNHWDHILGFPFFIPAYIQGFEFNIYSLLKADHRLKEIFEGLMGRTYFPVMLSYMGADLRFHEIIEETIVVGDTEVKSRLLNHPQGCLGYRITSGEMVVTYATDTEHYEGRMDENLLELADGADILIYDSQYTPEEYPSKKNFGHSTWEEGVKIARAAGVKKLLMFHHDPEHDDEFIAGMERTARANFPNLMAAYEGLAIADFPVEPTLINEDEENLLTDIPAPEIIAADSTVEVRCGETFKAFIPADFRKRFEKTISEDVKLVIFEASGIKYYTGAGLAALADAIDTAKRLNVKTTIRRASKKLIEKMIGARLHLVTQIEGYN